MISFVLMFDHGFDLVDYLEMIQDHKDLGNESNLLFHENDKTVIIGRNFIFDNEEDLMFFKLKHL